MNYNEPTEEKLAQAASSDLMAEYYKEARDFLYAQLTAAINDGNLTRAEALDLFKTYRAHCEKMLAVISRHVPLQSERAGITQSLLTLTFCAYYAGSRDAKSIRTLKKLISGGPAANAAAARKARAELSGSSEVDKIIHVLAQETLAARPSLSQAATAEAIRDKVNARIPELLKEGKRNAKALTADAIRKRLRVILASERLKMLAD